MDGLYARFDHTDIIPVKKVGPVHVAEMWHGPTGAFKDLALAIVGRLLDHFLRKRRQMATVLVATSGDTGSAAIHSILGSKNVNIFVLYPRDRLSRVQELQMTTVNAPNVTVYSADGTSDDGDIPVKKLFSDAEFVKKHNLVCLNSVNVSRVVIQAAHFAYSYLRVCPTVDREVLFCVPTGGMGNITGGYIAYTMGLPVRFLAGVNENDVVHRVFTSGVLALSEMLETHATAMDIQMPYNSERVFYFMSGGNCELVKTVMEEFEKTGRCSVPAEILGNNKCISTMRVTNDDTLSTMGYTWQKYGYLLCPHTAIGMRVALDYLGVQLTGKSESETAQKDQKDRIRDIVVIATATAAKFPETVERVGGIPLPSVPAITELYSKPERKLFMEKDEDWDVILRQAIAGGGQ